MKKTRALFIVTVVLLLILLTFDIVMLDLVIAMEGQPQTPTGGVVLVEPNATDEREEGGQGGSKNVTVAGFSALTVPPDIETVPIDLYNPIENNGLFYMTFEFRLLNDSEAGYEVLFKTRYVPPGKHIYQVDLTHGLPAGDYDAVLLIQPYRMSDLTPTNNVTARVKLTVK